MTLNYLNHFKRTYDINAGEHDMGTICMTNYDQKGNISNMCSGMSHNSHAIDKVSAHPVLLSIKEETSSASKRIKASNVALLEQIFSDCYAGKLPSKICEKPIDLYYFGMKSCPSCVQLKPEYDSWIRSLQSKRVPIRSTDINIKEDHADKFFTDVGCNATPCIVLRNPSNPSKYTIMSQGIPTQIQLLSNILGIKNPNFFPIDLKTIYPSNII